MPAADDYEVKFASLLRMCADATKDKLECVVVAHPEVLGDTYAELIESLNRIADAGLSLKIVPRDERKSFS